MNDPMDSAVVGLLERTASGLPPVDLVDGALDRAQRTRQRRRALAGAGVAVVALAVAISVTVLPGRGEVQPARQTPKPKIFQAPALGADIVQPALDASRIDSLPHADTQLPTRLVPRTASTKPPGRAVMVTKERKGPQQNLFALDPDMHWHMVQLDAPADIGNGLGPMLDPDALSPDGTRVALRGAKHMYVVDLATDEMTTRDISGGDAAHWTGNHTLEISGDYRRQETSDGDTVIRASQHGFTERQQGTLTVRAKVPPAKGYEATDLRAMPGRLAMVASPSFVGRKHDPGPGILVLDRPSYRGIAFLPSGFSDDVRLSDRTNTVPRGWIDEHTLLFSYAPWSSSTQYYLTWDIDTGTVSKVASVSQFWRDSSWAGQLLQR